MPTPDQTHPDPKDNPNWPVILPEHPEWTSPLPDWHILCHEKTIVIESAPLYSIEHCDSNTLEWFLALNLMRPCIQGERIAVTPNGSLKLQWGFAEHEFHADRWQHLTLTYQIYEALEFTALDMDRRPSSDNRSAASKTLLMQAWDMLQSSSQKSYSLILDDEELAIVIETSRHQPLFILPNIAFNTWELLQPIDLELHQNLLTARYTEIILQTGKLPTLDLHTRLGIDPEYNVLMARRAISAQIQQPDELWSNIAAFLTTVSTLSSNLRPMLTQYATQTLNQKWV